MNVMFVNGNWKQDIHIPWNERGFLYGDGVFTTIRVSQGNIECLEAHLNRLSSNCETLDIIAPIIDPELLYTLVKKNSAQNGVWRLKIIISGGISSERYQHKSRNGNVLMYLEPEPEKNKEELNLMLYPDPVMRPMSRIKSIACLDNLYIKNYAHKKGYDDALTTTQSGHLLEASFSNLFWVLDHTLFAPDPVLPLLDGIMLSKIIEACKSMNYQIVRSKIPFNLIPKQAHLYLCNSVMHFQPVVKVVDQKFIRNFDFEKLINNYLIDFI